MITILDSVTKTQENFWNHFLFHPTDAVEDPWGKRILDCIAADGAGRTVRIYTMFEDIVYRGESGELRYDFRLSDLRLDYLLEKGYDLLLAYGGVPDCIASSTDAKTSVSKNKTRYKGKLWNTSPPKDDAVWEEVCYTYTRHNVERYGEATVARWYCHCFNEPDAKPFFLSERSESREDTLLRAAAYCRMYAAFARGVRRALPRARVGGPALAGRLDFLTEFLRFVKDNALPLDFLSLHNYGTHPSLLHAGKAKLDVEAMIEKQRAYTETVRKCGFDGTEIVLDEWGAATGGFLNREEAPELMYRETEVFAAYYVKLICRIIEEGFPPSKMLICLSGQHEMTEDFSGFRNFFTLHFLAKPIYNAYVLASKLGTSFLSCENGSENVFVLPTKRGDGSFAVLLTYCSRHFEEDIPPREEILRFPCSAAGKTVTVCRVDRETTNPYRLCERRGMTEPLTEDDLRILREEAALKPVARYRTDGADVPLKLTANGVYLVTVTG